VVRAVLGGGIVVHASAGWAALASVLYVGRRKFVYTPHNIPFIALGTGSSGSAGTASTPAVS
jgi:ammonia channel protein AmtB